MVQKPWVGLASVLLTKTEVTSFGYRTNALFFRRRPLLYCLLLNTTPASKPIFVISDSASVLTTINSPTSRHPWIQAIQKDCPTGTVLLWVPGHCGINGNVEADQLAAIGRTGRMFTRAVPGADLKHWVKSTIRVAWAQEWVNTRHPFIRKIKGETTPWTDTANRHDQLILSRLRVGHTHASHNMGSRGPFHKICSTCNATMTVEHLLVNCPCYEGLRVQHELPNSIVDILANNTTNETTLLSFIKDAGLYNAIWKPGTTTVNKARPRRYSPGPIWNTILKLRNYFLKSVSIYSVNCIILLNSVWQGGLSLRSSLLFSSEMNQPRTVLKISLIKIIN